MKPCAVCKQPFDPEAAGADPAEEAGRFLARELYGDADDLCPACLASRGILGMMYCREFYG
jgi:hypothetical protein